MIIKAFYDHQLTRLHIGLRSTGRKRTPSANQPAKGFSLFAGGYSESLPADNLPEDSLRAAVPKRFSFSWPGGALNASAKGKSLEKWIVFVIYIPSSSYTGFNSTNPWLKRCELGQVGGPERRADRKPFYLQSLWTCQRQDLECI